ncbi:hypothetical protein C3942_00015 [Solimonas fluminis]|uniref:Peptidase n=1 Tax=Solimonas fluminis TaxID=2086571 RepID=A0A2S5TJZ6_9GAMM|nr:SapC family protein [Solimonas fluminis]PPE75326.1 hypothetical protein C3942_00015 [Solimonas fluminis]
MAKSVKLIAPPGYAVVEPLDKQKHAGMGLRRDAGFAWSSGINAAFLNAAEFFKAALDYPIAFVREPRSGEFLPMAILGLKARQNLFVDAQGQWRSQTYLPAYFRRHPFCIAELAGEAGAAPQRLVCVDPSALEKGSAQPLFGADGVPTPAWEAAHRLLEAMEGARQQTRALMQRLEALGLLVPFDAVAMPRQGERSRLQGLFRVDEEKLAELQARDFKAMARKGELRAVYAHLLSLENFARLLEYAQNDGR